MTGPLGEIPDWARNCPSGKQKFASANQARQIFRTESRRSATANKFKGTVHIYHCNMCDGYHLTRSARRRDGRKFNNPDAPPPRAPGTQMPRQRPAVEDTPPFPSDREDD